MKNIILGTIAAVVLMGSAANAGTVKLFNAALAAITVEIKDDHGNLKEIFPLAPGAAHEWNQTGGMIEVKGVSIYSRAKHIPGPYIEEVHLEVETQGHFITGVWANWSYWLDGKVISSGQV